MFTAKRKRVRRHPGVPNLLDTIVQDATYYFMFKFFVQILSQLFMFLAPVRDTQYFRGWLIKLRLLCVYVQEEIQLLPGM